MSQIINCHNLSLIYPVNFNTKLKSLPNFLGGKLDLSSGSILSLNQINITFNIGDRVAITGHNGSGKSTLLRVLAGIYQPTTGTVSFDFPFKITTAFDHAYGLDYELSGLDNIKIRFLSDHNNSNYEKFLVDVKSISGIGDYINLPVRTYSTGMVTRLMVGYLLALKSEVLMIDEGINFADSDFHAKVDGLIFNYINTTKLMVIATHDEQFIRKYCNRIIKMESGSIVGDFYV